MCNLYIQCPQVIKEADYIPKESLNVFLQYLENNGYSPGTIHQYLGAVLHFSRWQRQKGRSCVNAQQSDKADFIGMHLATCQCPGAFPRSKKPIAAALSHWLRLVDHRGENSINVSELDNLVIAFDQYLKDVSGLAPATRLYRCRYATEFLIWISNKPSIELKSLSFENVSSYISQRANEVSLETTASIACALNCFLRYLSTQGICSVCSSLCVPHPKLLFHLPSKKPLSTDELSRLLAAIDRSYPVGKRDYAIMRCLIDLGLRTSEVAELRLNNIDWKNKVLTLNCPKLRQQRKLPIPDTLLLALIDYIIDARPETSALSVFVYHRAPFGQAVEVSTIRGVARRALAKAGFPSSQSQVHRLRYTMATRLLTSEVSLKTIADVLGHQCINTTTRYTYINRKQLLTIALPWPGGQNHELDITG